MSSSLPEERALESEARAQAQPSRFERTFSALRYRDFRLLWLGAFTSTTGTFMQTFAQAWLVYRLTHSAFLLGFDGFLATGPMLLFSLFGGVIADRMERRKVMLLSQWMQMTFAVVLTVLVLLRKEANSPSLTGVPEALSAFKTIAARSSVLRT